MTNDSGPYRTPSAPNELRHECIVCPACGEDVFDDVMQCYVEKYLNDAEIAKLRKCLCGSYKDADKNAYVAHQKQSGELERQLNEFRRGTNSRGPG